MNWKGLGIGLAMFIVRIILANTIEATLGTTDRWLFFFAVLYLLIVWKNANL